MKRYAKMMLMNGRDESEDRKKYDGWNDPYYMPENKFKDRTGREHYDNGKYAPKAEYEPMGGRYYQKDHDDIRDSMYYPPDRSYPPYYSNERSNPMYAHMDNDWEENKRMIGFSLNGKIDQPHGNGNIIPMRAGKMDKHMAEAWMSDLENADGTTGPHWTMDQIKQAMAQRGIEADPVDFWVAMNAEYSDRCKQYKKHGVNTIDMYIDGVMDFWMHDKDAVNDKLASYYKNVVKH